MNFETHLTVDCKMCFRWKAKCDCCTKDSAKATFWNANLFCKGDHCHIKSI